MREERRREQAKRLNLLKGIEEENEEIDEKDEKEELEEKEEKKSHKFLIITILIILLLAAYSTYIEPKYLFKVNEYMVNTKKIDKNMHGLKIVVFSDIHYGITTGEKELKNYVEKINALKPDIIFFTGDLFDKNINVQENSINTIKEELKKLDASLYKYAIFGDQDYSNKEQYLDVLNASNFILIDNESKLLYNESNTPIVITGINKYDKKDNSFITNPIEEIDTSNYLRIILDHEPDNIDSYINTHPDLIFNAHSLGGLIKIPKIGGIINNKGSKKHNKTYEKINNTLVYNSSGLGTSNIRIRLNNPPSISLFRLYLDKK